MTPSQELHIYTEVDRRIELALKRRGDYGCTIFVLLASAAMGWAWFILPHDDRIRKLEEKAGIAVEKDVSAEAE